MKSLILVPFFIFLISCGQGDPHALKQLEVGAQQTALYIPLLEQKAIAVVANQTSLIGEMHLVDSLLKSGIAVKRVFSPEHGFRGTADAGELIDNVRDAKTGLPIISLYGKHKKPTQADLSGIDLVVFDIQDVGVRFYTYISTLHYVMEACAENQIPLLILDRPNPNGFYMDGPVLDTALRSFVGMHPVPLVHGMTLGEYALLINGEGWLGNDVKCQLQVIPCKNYTHKTRYELPVKPSPNLPNPQAVCLYPSLALFEGTVVSVGRGTDFPFQVYGHPALKGAFEFTPQSTAGAKKPKLENELCRGRDLRLVACGFESNESAFTLNYLIEAYGELYNQTDFFNSFFAKLAGTRELQQQIEDGWSEAEIRQSWEPALSQFRTIRSRYLLYEDF
ncbi:MAG: exo-beta-N-acetylmuramidase NamZ domain-containing protein [Salinivirgaceae bacterium]